jgi:hypothetical protein
MAPITDSRTRVSSCAAHLITIVLAAACGLLGGCDRPSSERTAPAPKLDYGTKVNFGQGGNSDPFKSSGWSVTEQKFTWSEGTSAVLRMTVDPSSENVALKMTIAALVKEPELPSQPVELHVNDQKITEWQVGNTAEFTATLPQDLTRAGGPLSITLKTPKAKSPKELGLSQDARVLGVCCFSMELLKN